MMRQELIEGDQILAVNLRIWQRWLQKACPVSIDNQSEFWQSIIANTATREALLNEMSMTETAGEWHMSRSKSYLAVIRLLELRDMGMLPTPAEVTEEQES